MTPDNPYESILQDLVANPGIRVASSIEDSRVLGNILISFMASEIARLAGVEGGASSNEPSEAE